MLSVSELAGRLTGTLNRYQLSVSGRSDLDVESFSATEGLSQTYCYQITFTSGSDIAPGEMLLQDATFTFNTPGSLLGDIALSEAARSIHGVVTQFQRLSASVDEVRYQLTLEPRLALLANAGRPAIYQNQSVPEIIEQVLRQQHQFEGWQFEFRLRNSYPPREQVMQWQESDRAFIDRLLAEVGIWYRFEMDARLKREVVVFADDQQFYQFDVSLPLRSPSGMNDNGVESVWGLSSAHQVVSQSVRVKDYNYRQAGDGLQTEAEVSGGGESTYGQVYRYGDNYLTLGGESGESGGETAEGGDFYARLRHERLLNNQHQLSGKSNASTLAPGQMLEIVGGVPDSFAKGVLITTISAGARRDSSYTLKFTGIPYSETVGFRPEPEARPRIAGTLPARVTSITAGDTYAHLDKMGRYRVKFDFDLDNWKTGYESLWVRLAKPYSGDTYGMHLPLLAGTEVAIAFEEGNPDRPYIAYALHDSRHPDHVTQANNKRNVIRTPANNKLRMEDERGKEHIKLSTEYGGKSQLNLGHLVDGSREQRGEGFELRTDQWGAIRAGKGIFISAEGRERAGSEQLDMQEAIAQLENARSEAQGLRHAELADIEKQTALLNETLKALKQQAVLISAPSGIAQVTPGSVQLSAGENLIATSGADGDISIGKSFRVAVRETLSLFAQRLGIKLLAAAGKVEVQAQSDAMDLLAQKQLTVASQDDRVVVTAKTELLLNCGGGYIRLKDGQIELGGPNNVLLKTAVVQRMSAASLNVPLPALPAVGPAVLELDLRDLDMSPVAHAAYTLTFEGGSVITGQLDENGYARHDDVPDEPANVHYELPPSKPEPQWDPWRSMLDESDIWVGTITGGNN
ncbi:type VI secretion system Vgr family protein [Brenneria goodwinii]|uniref:type VI secretion system Vgr family protein n=18 Tax=Brenneria goodwinii TaxID=1109412 RepID=UPI000EF188CB|nr:type VI secretion system Vgr family protein [Brenneria goodwinii]RLM22928.1 type IV secretion protein Rhs [Brenneria goodwinii]